MTTYTKPPVKPAWGETNTTTADMITPPDSDIQTGWPLSDVPPSRQRFNWILNYVANATRYFMQRGLVDYDATETYGIGARVIGDDGKTYRSLVASNINHTPSSSPTQWELWALSLTDLVSVFRNQTYTAFTTGGTTGTFTLTPSPAATSYASGQRFRVKFNAVGNGSDTINVSGLGAVAIKQYDFGGSKINPVIANGQLTDIEYDGVNFVILDPLPQVVDPALNDFRLTLTTGVPVTIADVTAATTLYLTPYKGNKIGMADGTILTSAEISIAIPATTSQMYDVFVYNNGGVATLELLAWTNDSTRATALVMSNGLLVKSGATTRRYVGSVRTGTVSGQTEDSMLNRYLWNYSNRVKRCMSRTEPATSWTYSSTVIRQANGNGANQLNFIIGVGEDEVTGIVSSVASTASAGVGIAVSIGFDSTSVEATGIVRSNASTPAAGVPTQFTGFHNVIPSAGKHALVWLEYVGSGTATFSSQGVSGIKGSMTA